MADEDTSFVQSFDARDWAEAFCDRFWLTRNSNDPDVSTELDDQVGLMIGWFANAIMRGWDEHARRYPAQED